MDSRLTKRLAELRTEFESGQVRLSQLEVEQTYLRERLLMLKGAINVIEDLLTGAAAEYEPPDTSGNGHAQASVVTVGDAASAKFASAPAVPDGSPRPAE